MHVFQIFYSTYNPRPVRVFLFLLEICVLAPLVLFTVFLFSCRLLCDSIFFFAHSIDRHTHTGSPASFFAGCNVVLLIVAERERESCERAMDPPTKDSLCMCVRVVCLSIDLGSPSFLPSECFKHEGRERDKPGMKQLDSHRLGSRRHHHSGRAVEMHYGEERGQKYKRERDIEKEIHQSAKWVGYGGSPSSRASNTIRRKDASPDLIESKASHSSREEGKRESWTAAHNFGARHTRRLNSQWDSCLCVCLFFPFFLVKAKRNPSGLNWSVWFQCLSSHVNFGPPRILVSFSYIVF